MILKFQHIASSIEAASLNKLQLDT